MGLGQEHAFLTPVEVSTVDFLDDVKKAKGLGEKVMTILFTNDLVTYEEALIRGVKGLIQLTGIGPKKAEALILLAEEQKKQLALEKKSAKMAMPEVKEPADTETPDNDKTPAEEALTKGDVQEEDLGNTDVEQIEKGSIKDFKLLKESIEAKTNLLNAELEEIIINIEKNISNQGMEIDFSRNSFPKFITSVQNSSFKWSSMTSISNLFEKNLSLIHI